MNRICTKKTQNILIANKLRKALFSALLIISSIPLSQAMDLTTEKQSKNTIAQGIQSEESNQTADKIKQMLIEKLNNIQFFNAKFSQVVIDVDGNILQQGAGSLAISKPNLVHWQTTEPDETLIISDGKELWFYDPFIEQVTVYLLNNAIVNTPILLLTSDDEKLWNGYTVSQLNNNIFLIHSLDTNSQIKTLELHFSDDNQGLSKISFLDATGQLSHITLLDTDYKKAPEPTLFKFTLPEGVTVDDQR